MTQPNPQETSRFDQVFACVNFLGAAVFPLWGINRKTGFCDCPKGKACAAAGKHPYAKFAPEGFKNASRDPSIIRDWIGRYQNSNFAARCGDPMPGGGFLGVLDEDPRNGCAESLASLPGLPETVTQITGRGDGGRHRFYRFQVSPAGRTIAPGLDLQGNSKYIVLAPSRHASGGDYHFDLGLGPGEIDVPDAPAWLVDGTEAATPRPERDGEDTARYTVLGELFTLAGRAGPVMENGTMLVNCPNSDTHSDARGKGSDPSCVVLPPAGGSRFGGFSCRHGHCVNLKWHEVLKMMPPEMVKAAQKKYPLKAVTETVVTGPKLWEPPAENWEAELKQMMAWKTTKTGHKPIADIVNAITILTYDPRWKGVLRFDEFSQVLRFTSPPQWHKDDAAKDQSSVWTDSDCTRLDSWMRRNWALELANEKLREAVYVVGMRDSINPLKEWLDSLVWDGTPRLSTWLPRYLGTDNTPYAQAAGRKWIISAIARGMTPGCKADHVLILEGGQGVGKSTALKALAGGDQLFTDSPIDIGNKDSFVSLRGRWIIELAELASLSKSESERSKAFFSSATDSYRPPYGRELIAVPRTCVFAGSTNLGQYLNDDTGGRRYWPVQVGVIDIQGLTHDRDQLWAEAVAAFKAGEAWWPSYEELPLFQKEQLAREVSDPWYEDIERWVNSNQGQDILSRVGYFTNMQIAHYALGILPKDANHSVAIRIGRVMYHMGYKKVRMAGKPAYAK
jgi:predicted P-loop ATPase